MVKSEGIRLIVGLGNPGAKYALTRHNAGFWFVDALAYAHGERFRGEPKFQGEACQIAINDTRVGLFKPLSFMNRSGLPVRQFTAFYRIPLDQALVVHDEIDLPPGKVRLKYGGGHGGHNGLRDIFAHVGADFWRLRLGVGHPGHKDLVIGYVLSQPPQTATQAIMGAIDQAAAVLPELIQGRFEQAMQVLHSD